MARDARRRRPAAGSSPVEQLEVWRDWRHDTAEFPAVPDAQPEDRRDDNPRRTRPRTGVVLGATLVLAAAVLSGLAVLGVGPVARLVGSGGSRSPAVRSTPSGTTTPSSRTSTGTAPDPVTSTGPAPTTDGPGDRRPGPPGPAGTHGSPPQPPVGGPAG